MRVPLCLSAAAPLLSGAFLTILFLLPSSFPSSVFLLLSSLLPSRITGFFQNKAFSFEQFLDANVGQRGCGGVFMGGKLGYDDDSALRRYEPMQVNTVR